MVEVVGSGLVYLGALATTLGAVSALRPLRRLGLRRRAHGLGLLALGLAVILIGVALPAQETTAVVPRTRLDAFVPAWQFAEVHTIRVHSSPARAMRAVKDVTADEIRFFRTLTWIRNPRRPWAEAPESILAAPAHRPILDVALHSGFVSLADEPGPEVAVGMLVCCHGARAVDAAAFAAATGPGLARAGMNFLVEDEGSGWARVTTETRIQATDDEARRRFAAYWRAIYPGSALIRRMWLRAIKARAEREESV